MYERYKRFFKEDINLSSQETIISKGEKLYHGTAESFDVRKIGTGGYDDILWTTDSIKIARYYIPVSGSSIARIDINLDVMESYLTEKEPWYSIVKNQLGISDLLKRKLLDKGYEENKKKFELYKKLDEIKKQFKVAEKENDNAYESKDQDRIKETDKILSDILKQWSIIEKEYNDTPTISSEKYLLEAIKLALKTKFGYIADKWGAVENVKTHFENKKEILLPADYRLTGKVVILTPKRDLKLFNHALGKESDLLDPEYHHLGLFRKLESEGYDGVVINDFAQSEHWGNYGHIAYGLFKNTIKDLNISTIRNQTHPED